MESFLAEIEKRAFRMAEYATGHPEEALDIVQDAMIKLVEKYSHREPEEWGPLFYRILQSRINDWHRKQRIRKRFSFFFKVNPENQEADLLQTLPDPKAFEPDRILSSERSGEALNTAVKSLPLRQQQAFLLRYWEGLNVRQTASAMQCSEGSVKTHCSRALATLREKVGNNL